MAPDRPIVPLTLARPSAKIPPNSGGGAFMFELLIISAMVAVVFAILAMILQTVE